MCIRDSGFFVNFLFFIQGIGTSGSQSSIGNWATDISLSLIHSSATATMPQL